MNLGDYDDIANGPWTEVRFWAQVHADAERTVVCSPNLESRVKGWVAARLMAGLITVKPSRLCPDDQIWVLDEHAIAASTAEYFAQTPPPRLYPGDPA